MVFFTVMVPKFYILTLASRKALGQLRLGFCPCFTLG
jgi:hypothetical protein